MAKMHPLRAAVIKSQRKKLAESMTPQAIEGAMMWLIMMHQADVWSDAMPAPTLPAVKQAVNHAQVSCRTFNILWEKHLKGKEGFDYGMFWDLSAQLSDVTKAFTRDPKRMHSMATKIIKETPIELED